MNDDLWDAYGPSYKNPDVVNQWEDTEPEEADRG